MLFRSQGLSVPEVLMSGHHAHIERWRREQSLSLSARYRPELVAQARSAGGLSKEDEAFLSRLPANGASENSKKL